MSERKSGIETHRLFLVCIGFTKFRKISSSICFGFFFICGFKMSFIRTTTTQVDRLTLD